MRAARTRELDIVLWGATGFTGRLVAEYLARATAGSDLRWALGGRDAGRLQALRGELSREHPALASLPLMVGDSFDRSFLEGLAERSAVVCSTVGPYAKYGDDLVAACAEKGTDYCDLAGEVAWMQRMVDAHHERALGTGARIVHCCGFDSIPSDLGTFLLQDYTRREHGASCTSVKFLVTGMRGSWSGGTMATATVTAARAQEHRQDRQALANPYALNPPGERHGPDPRSQRSAKRDPDLGVWTAPTPMAFINEPVVRRTNALLGYPYGRDFRYHEAIRTSPGAAGALRAAAVAAGLGVFGAALVFGPTRRLMERFVLPAPGQGPSRAAIERGFFSVRLYGEGQDPAGSAFHTQARVAASSDPGYGATALMLGESALCLALDEGEPGLPGGVLTPASAMGLRLIERLRAAGMTLEAANGRP